MRLDLIETIINRLIQVDSGFVDIDRMGCNKLVKENQEMSEVT